MKKLNLKYFLLLFGIIAVMLSFHSCKEINNGGGNLSAPEITSVYLEDAQSTVKDRLVDFVRLGQTVRLEGANFLGVTKVLVNGYSCYFNPTLVTNTSMIFTVFQTTASTAIYTDPSVKNTITLIKGDQTCSFTIDVRAAKPAITSVSHTMPQAGDVITIYGTGLQGVESVIFPGNIQGTNITSDDVDGKWCQVTVPDGITTSGSLTVIGANGGAYSPANFNYKEGLLHNFDDVQNFSWGFIASGTSPLTDVIPASGTTGPKSQGGYQCFNPDGNLAGGADQRYWLNSTNVQKIINNLSNLSASSITDSCGIQMDIYVNGIWNSGVIRFVMADGWGASRYCMLYQPVYPNGAAYDPTAFVNPGCWFTVTLPFSLSSDFTGKTLGDVLSQMASAQYQQCGPWFENSGLADPNDSSKSLFDAVPATEKIYFDNIRIVPLSTPSYSDFPDE